MGRLRKQESLERLTETTESRRNLLTPYGVVLPILDIIYSVEKDNALVFHQATFILSTDTHPENNIHCIVYNKNPHGRTPMHQFKGYGKTVAERFASPYQGSGILFTPEQVETMYNPLLEISFENIMDKNFKKSSH